MKYNLLYIILFLLIIYGIYLFTTNHIKPNTTLQHFLNMCQSRIDKTITLNTIVPDDMDNYMKTDNERIILLLEPTKMHGILVDSYNKYGDQHFDIHIIKNGTIYKSLEDVSTNFVVTFNKVSETAAEVFKQIQPKDVKVLFIQKYSKNPQCNLHHL